MARKERAYLLEIGLVQTHVHLLGRVHPTVAVSQLVKRLKGASSAVAAQEGLGTPGALAAVRAYLRRQPTHHPKEAIAGWEGDAPEYDLAGG